MTDHINPPPSKKELDSSPATSLASIPVRRRRKSGGAVVPAETASRQTQPAPVQPSSTPRRETFGKAKLPVTENPVPEALADAASPMPVELPDSAPQTTGDDQSAALPTEAIIELWESLADEDSIPSLLDLDITRVAIHWPNSLLLRATGSPRRPELEVERIFSADPAHNTAPLPIDTMTIDWMMALAREVTHDGVPVHELDNVSDDDPTAEYGVIALPFGSSPEAVDHVLCHFYRYDGAPEAADTLPEPEEQSASRKPDRKMMASIFGRRRAAAG